MQLNHPRFRITALYDGTGWDGVKWPPPFPLAFDAVEVLAGYSAFNAPGDRRFDDSVRDFYTLVDHGHLVAPLGNSDTHDLRWVLAYANSWPALALELAAVVVFRSLLGVLFITLAWPSKTRLPRRLFVNFALATVVGLVVL